MSQGSSSGARLSITLEKLPRRVLLRGSRFQRSVPCRSEHPSSRTDCRKSRSRPQPYYLAAHLGGNQALLKRNPNYGGTRPHRFEAILYTMAGPTPAAVDHVERGTADYAAAGPCLAPGSPGRTPLRRSGDGDERRYLRTPLLGTDYPLQQ